jgi:hypothetical protein
MREEFRERNRREEREGIVKRKGKEMGRQEWEGVKKRIRSDERKEWGEGGIRERKGRDREKE